MHEVYVTAVIECIKAGQKPGDIFAGLKSVLARRGHERLLSRIVRTLERELARVGTSEGAVLTVATHDDAKSKLVQALMTELGVAVTPQVVVDETIIGGAKLRHGAVEVDATYKTTLINLYHTITK